MLIFASLLMPLLASASSQITMQDDLLNHLVGDWRITRQFPHRKAENMAKIRWTLQGHWLLIEMKDVSKPAKYEAHVYITKMQSNGTYSIHWLDNYGGTVPEMLGIGTREGNSIKFSFKDSDSELLNTFTWHPETHAWTSKIDQTDD